jgi:LysR family nitrogen assimilation transcriptional regulator
MNLRQLRYFVCVIEVGNMTRAADRLHVAQTALGMQIRQLEEDLGISLLVRHSRGIEPTSSGRLLYDRALAILKLVEQTRQEVVASDKQASEIIRFGITPALMVVVGTELTLIVREEFPQVILRMVEAMSHVQVEMLQRGEVDFILGYDVPDLPQFARTALVQDDLVLVTHPGPQKRQPISCIDALDEPLAMPEEGDSIRNAATRLARELGIELRVSYEVRSIAAMKSLAGRGVASCILPYPAVADEVLAGKLDARPIVTPAIRRTLFLASSRQAGPFRNEVGLMRAVQSSLKPFLDLQGPLAEPLWVRTA